MPGLFRAVLSDGLRSVIMPWWFCMLHYRCWLFNPYVLDLSQQPSCEELILQPPGSGEPVLSVKTPQAFILQSSLICSHCKYFWVKRTLARCLHRDARLHLIYGQKPAKRGHLTVLPSCADIIRNQWSVCDSGGVRCTLAGCAQSLYLFCASDRPVFGPVYTTIRVSIYNVWAG